MHCISKASKPNHDRLLRHDLIIVPHARIIMGWCLKGIIYEMYADIPYTLPPLLYFLVIPGHIYPAFTQAGLV